MSTPSDRPSLVLASGSRARREMLTNAGLTFEVVPAKGVDETAIRQSMQAHASADTIAAALAIAKAEAVSSLYPESLVIGADQILTLGERLFEKPRNVAEARVQLLDLRGQTHVLHSAVALATGGQMIFGTAAEAALTMRNFSEAFLDDYLARAGNHVTESVGAYQLEGLGVQLFEAIEGDYFTILGMPLLPLLVELRLHGVIST